jgi:hypothetical protein
VAHYSTNAEQLAALGKVLRTRMKAPTRAVLESAFKRSRRRSGAPAAPAPRTPRRGGGGV